MKPGSLEYTTMSQLRWRAPGRSPRTPPVERICLGSGATSPGAYRRYRRLRSTAVPCGRQSVRIGGSPLGGARGGDSPSATRLGCGRLELGRPGERSGCRSRFADRLLVQIEDEALVPIVVQVVVEAGSCCGTPVTERAPLRDPVIAGQPQRRFPSRSFNARWEYPNVTKTTGETLMILDDLQSTVEVIGSSDGVGWEVAERYWARAPVSKCKGEVHRCPEPAVVLGHSA